MSWLGALIGGIFGSKQQRDQNANNLETYKLQRADNLNDMEEGLSRLRTAADKAGFNPLTALGATGGQGYNSLGVSRAPPLASQSLLANSIQAAGVAADEYLQGKAHDRKNKEIKPDASFAPAVSTRPSVRPKLGPSKMGGIAPKAPSLGQRLKTSVPTGDPQNLRPKSRPGLWSSGKVPVIGPDGGNMVIPKKWADRLDLKPFDAFIGEDYEAFLGDEIGQVVLAPKIPSAALQLEGGIFRQRTVEEREKILNDPFSPTKYFPKLTPVPDPPKHRRRGAQKKKEGKKK